MSTKLFVFTLLLTLLLGTLAGCTTMHQGAMPMAEMAATDAPPQPEPGKLTIVDVRARPAPLAGGTGAVYFTVLNGLDQAVQLVSASSPAAEVVETHETTNENGVMKMSPLPDGYPIAAGEALLLQPGGKHIMLIGLVEPLEPGDEVELTVNFDNGESMALTVPVMDMQMSGMNMGDMEMGGEAMAGEGMDAGAMEGHDHGAMTDADHMAMMGLLKDAAPEVKAAIMALPLEAILKANDSLMAGTLDPAFAATVSGVIDQVSATTWPEGLQAHFDEVQTTATDLLAALEAGDAAAAGPLATDLYDMLHEIAMGVME